MSCFFCNSSFHVSHNCNNYISDVSRKEVARMKNCCLKCFASNDEHSLIKCENSQKCYICFSENHLTVYCPLRFTAPKFFPVNINNDLLPRFFQLLKFEEKYSLLFSYPDILNNISLKPLLVNHIHELKFPTDENISNFGLIMANFVLIGKHDETSNDFVSLKSYKGIGFFVKNVDINQRTFSSDDLLQLLSIKTRSLTCNSTVFLPKMTFEEIIRNAPNLEFIDIRQTNIELSIKWRELLLLIINSDKLNNINIKMSDLNIPVEDLVVLLKEKSDKLFKLHIYYTILWHDVRNRKKLINGVKNKLSKYFALTEHESKQCFKITYLRRNGKVYNVQCYELLFSA